MRNRPCILTLLLLSIFSLFRLSAETAIEVDTVIGFSGLIKPGRWNPVQISVYNPGKDVEGEIAVEVMQGTAYRTEKTHVYRRKVVLPSRSRKRYSFAVPISSPGVPISVQITAGTEVLFTAEYSLLGKIIDSPLMLALSRSSSFDFLMQLSDIIVTYPHAESLPARWDAYDAVDFVSFHNADLGKISEAQSTALLQWVEDGGTLFISGGIHLTRQLESLSGLFPVTVMGLARVPVLDDIENAFEVNMPWSDEIVVSMSMVKGGVVIARAGKVPLLVEEQRGNGRIFFFAGDIGVLPFSDISFKTALWDYIESQASFRPKVQSPGRIFEDSALPGLIDLQQDRGYSRRVLLGFLTVYLLGVYIFVLRRSGRPMRRWIAGLCVSTLLTTGAYLMFSRNLLRSDYLMVDRTTISAGLNRNFAEAQKDIVLVSLSESMYSIKVNRPDTMVLDRGQARTSIHEDRNLAIENIEVYAWGRQSYRFLAKVPFTLTGHLVRKGDTLELLVENSSGSTIQDTILFYRGEVFFAETLSPGEQLKMNLNFLSSPMADSLNALDESDFEDRPARFLVLKSLMEENYFIEAMEAGSVILLGWLSDPFFNAETSGKFLSSREVNILFTEIDLEKEGINAQP
ncbi:MAG: hypothetical protein HN368_17610 [Spirochaetales bacterium]|jgi:hypothetical protein|nr:hypothetical protein [Spirochaetales bacterium]